MPVLELEPVEDPGRAGLLMHPLRQRILAEATTPSTAADIARRVGLPAQKVNYHVRTLADAGFLRPAGEGRKRNLVEKRYRATARAYLLLPQVLGDMSPDVTEADRFSATYLLGLSALLQRELGAWLTAGATQAAGVPTLSMEAEIRFETAEQRARFANELQQAVAGVIERNASPSRSEDGTAGDGRPYRIIVGAYPIPEAGRDAAAPAPTILEGDGHA